MALPDPLGLVSNAQALAGLVRSGILRPERPDRAARMLYVLRRNGPLAAACATSAIRYGESPALADELGTLTFADLDRRSNAIANAWRAAGLGERDGVGILCRNHRGFLDATFAAAKLGLRTIYLNTDFAGPQVRDVIAREDPAALAFDDDLAELVGDAGEGRLRYVATPARDAAGAAPDGFDGSLEQLIAAGDPSPPPAPGDAGEVVMLTSGTTGTPKGAPREQPRSLRAAGVFARVPFRSREAFLVGPPLFHALGFGTSAIALGTGCTLVVRRRFDPAEALALAAEHRVTTMILVPVMLQRMLDLGEDELRRRDLSALRIVLCGGAALPPGLAARAQDTLGDVVYNLYGSTEVAIVSIANPAELRAAPGCVGRPPPGTRVRILDERGQDVPQGTTGRIFAGTGVEFAGYTGGGTKEVVDGLMATGDVGHLDDAGRLHVDGRDDDMIVSGGENVFPQEVEQLLARHPSVSDAVAVGVPDERFGQRLRAYVVAAPAGRPSEDELKEYVRSNLARYKVPREIVFVDELPRNPAGKVVKRLLPEP